MGRSQSKERKLKYSNAREMVEKRAAGFSAPYLKMPEGAQLFKPKAGVMLIDIVPYVAGPGNPWAEEGLVHYERTFWVHKGIGANGDSFLCARKTSNEKCAICEYRAKLQAAGDDDKEELIASLAPKERQLFNVINRKEPDKGIQLWDISYHLFGKLLAARIRDSDEEDGWDRFFTLDEGFSLKLGFEEKTFAGRAFLSVETIDFKPREALDEELLDDAHALDEILVETDYDKLKKILTESADDEDDEDEPKSKKKDRDDDDDEEDEEDEEEEQPRRGSKKSKDDDEEEDADEEGEEEDDSDDEEEDEPKKGKKKSKKDDDDDFDDFDQDDEDEPKKGKQFGKSKGDKGWDNDDEDEDDDAPSDKKKGRR